MMVLSVVHTPMPMDDRNENSLFQMRRSFERDHQAVRPYGTVAVDARW
jgi:hypothetical protein